MKKIRLFLFVLLCLFVFLPVRTLQASQDVSQRTVRVGFFSADGYHVMDKDGTKSGYGYDFLQMMLRYNNWKYEYIGYDKNWGDMLDMLREGKIDMVTLANKTPEREKEFAYSEKSIGTSSTIMSIRGDNNQIIAGEYETYEGAVVGMVRGSSHNEKFEEYAKEKGFHYTIKYYEDIADLLADLRAGKNIDIAVTSNMRQVQDEIILDEFNATEYYAIVKKGNEALLEEMNRGIAQLNVYSPDWRTVLFEKYYSDINSKVISLSIEEREYLTKLKESKTVIKAAMNPELKPYSYFEGEKARGIAPTIFAEIADRLEIDYEILPAKDRWEYKEQLNSGQADIDLTAYLDYSLAQKYNLKETDAYMDSTLAMLTTKNSNLDKKSMVVAVLNDPTEYIGYNKNLIDQYKHRKYESTQECMDAVKEGKADATFCYVYIAEQAVLNDYTNRLQYNLMPDCSFSLSIGVNNERDHRLLSVLNKGVSSLSPAFTQGVLLEESTDVQKEESLLAVVYDYPWIFIGTIVVVLMVVFVIILLAVMNREQKNKLLASKERERFIGYVCESYELVVEVNLERRQRKVYKMKNNLLLEETKDHRPFDRDFFEKILLSEDVDRMTEAFSETKIDRMIAAGGGENYLECQLKEKEGGLQWYSYIIKAVPKDAQHPRNFVVFKKNINGTKQEEERQKQALKDALENARNASRAKGQFLSKMSHEIRTPLNAVIGYMEIAKDSADNADKVMHCVRNSGSAAKHLLNIINDVLDISSIESGKMKIASEEFDLKSQLTSLTAIFFHQAKEKKIKFDVALENVTREWVVGDSMRLNQILMNLLSNAIKFTPENGKVTLAVKQMDGEQENVFMKFTVRDTGIGMSEEYKKRLFQPFEQESAQTARKFGGTGLGLSITYNLIQMMGGSIEVTSKLGEGTSFFVSLSFGKGSKEHEHGKKQQDYSKVRALIVDDEKSSCEYMKSLLKRCKIKCTLVKSGEEAIRQMKRRMGTEYSYDLCIMDWNMPKLNGIETARRMKEECDSSMPIIIATAYDVTEIEEEARAAGITKVVAKPLFQSTMFDLLVSTYGKYEPVRTKEKDFGEIRGMRILLAEDNPMNLEIATDILQKAGLCVDTATDGKQAVDRFLESPVGTYDAILMDIQMPVMDGYQATGAIRASHHEEAADIPIIAMTANAFAEDVNAALAAGMNGHIAKPVEYDKLYQILSHYSKKKENSNGQKNEKSI